jgi:hypothetical protein
MDSWGFGARVPEGVEHGAVEAQGSKGPWQRLAGSTHLLNFSKICNSDDIS